MSEEVTVSEAQEELGSNLPPAEAAKPRKRAAKGMTVDRTWIQLEENDDIPPTGLFLGHNGTGYLLKPGEPAEVPNHIIEILDHAVTTMPVTDPVNKRVIGHRDRMRFPYRRVAAPEAQG
jgi:hypothetical protein